MEKLWNSNYLKVWGSNFMLHFSFTLIVPLLPLYLNQTYGAAKDTIGVVLAGYAVMALVVRPFSGYLTDVFPRKAALLLFNFFFVATYAGYIAAGSLTAFAIFRTLHGAPFGALTVATNAAAVDSLPQSRRTEGLGYFGLSNNLATAIGPMLAIYLLDALNGNFQALFTISLGVSLLGLILDASLKLPKADFVREKKTLSLDKFFLMDAMPEAVTIALFSLAHGVMITYTAIYGRQYLGVTTGTGLFFTLFATGLILSRLTGARALRKEKVSRNASIGIVISIFGYTMFALLQNELFYYISAFVIGLGNGHWYPAFLNMFVNLADDSKRGAANSSILTAWDAGKGLGVLLGGVISEHLGYMTAFTTGAASFVLGSAMYFAFTKAHYERTKLR